MAARSSALSLVEVERRESVYNALLVRRRGAWTDLDVAGATFASHHATHLLTGYSWDALFAGTLLGARPPARVLVLGLGGGTCVRPLLRAVDGVHVTGVELDKDVIELSRAHLGLDTEAIDVVIGDADRYVSTTHARFDAIVDDLFLSGVDDVHRAGAAFDARLTRLHALLNEGGVVVANFITDGAHAATYRDGRRAFTRTFDVVKVVKPPRGLNAILVGGTRVAGKRAITSVRGRFESAHDRARLDELTVRRVARPD